MSQIVDTYFRKLSTPVNVLDISPKACRSLQRAGISTVAEIVLAGRPKIDSIRHVGSITVDEIWRAAARYLDLSEDELKWAALWREETEHETREYSIMALRLPPSTFEKMWFIGIYLIDDLVRSRTLEYNKFRFMSAAEIAVIDRALCFYMTRSALLRLWPRIETVERLDVSMMEYSFFNDQDLTLQLPGIHEQAWRVLEMATMQFLSPSEITAQVDGFAQFRVPRMIKDAQERLHRHLFSLSIFLDHFEEQSKIFEKDFAGKPQDLETLATALLSHPTKSFLIIEKQEVVRMILLVRSLIICRVHWIWNEMEPKWTTFIRLCCLVPPDLKKHVYFRRMFRELKQDTDPIVSIPSQYKPPAPPKEEPDWRRQLSRINERAWLILELGTLEMLSMQRIGAQAGSISGARVYQIIQWTQEILQKSIPSLSPFLDHLEEKSQLLQKELGNNPLDLGVLVHHLTSDPVHPDLLPEERAVRHLIILIRSMVLYRSSWFWKEMEPRWPTFILLSCLVEPLLKKHEQVRLLLVEQKPVKNKNEYQDLVHTVLVKAGKPLHWSRIAEQASQLGGRDLFSSKSMLGRIQYEKDRFVRVGPGTYGLAEWNLRTPASYTHVIASILKEEGKPMSEEQIFDRVLGFRSATLSSVNIVLNTHYRFYKSILNTYGLRGWLPATDGQDCPVPDWLMEKPSSLNREKRARAKGLPIDHIISQDNWQ